MNIALIIAGVNEALGPGKRLCIWTSGCLKHCYNCATPELQALDKIKDIDIIEKLKSMNLTGLDGVTISGGEPFLQMKELSSLVEFLSVKFDDILIYSGMTYESLKLLDGANDIFSKISVLVDGEYIDELNQNEKLRGSTNQNILIFKEKYRLKYESYNKLPRKQEIFQIDGKIFGVGLKNKEKNYE
ncbi:MAG: radical SAM protein [Erysipelotrichales bacterium]|nr:radical SAM protein [Erysipelotrichales bacterium]